MISRDIKSEDVIPAYDCYKIYTSLIGADLVNIRSKYGSRPQKIIVKDLAFMESEMVSGTVRSFDRNKLYWKFNRNRYGVKRIVCQPGLIEESHLESALKYAGTLPEEATEMDQLRKGQVQRLIKGGVLVYELGSYWITPIGIKGWRTIRDHIAYTLNKKSYPRGQDVFKSVEWFTEPFFTIAGNPGKITPFLDFKLLEKREQAVTDDKIGEEVFVQSSLDLKF